MKTEKILMTMAVEGARAIGRHFDSPDDDWVPTMVCVSEDGEVNLCALVMPEDEKDNVAAAVTAALQEFNAVAAVLIMSAWTVNRQPDDLDGPRPSECADRRETLVFTYADCDSIKMTGYGIERHDDTPPTLTDESVMSGIGLDVAGRFADALRFGLVRAE